MKPALNISGQETDEVDLKPAAPAEDSLFSTGDVDRIYDLTGERFDDEVLDDFLLYAHANKASDITLQDDTPAIGDVGGRLLKMTSRKITKPEIEQALARMYGDNANAEMKSGHDLDFAYEIRRERERVRFRVNATAGRTAREDGIQITLRSLPDTPIPVEMLGLEQAIIDNFRPSDGLVFITGPTGSGKSTLLSSLMAHQVEKEDANEKVLEYSKPIEYVYDKIEMPSSIVWQVDVGKHLHPRGFHHSEESEFAYCVRNALRRKPTAIIIGESRDAATIRASVEASLTGHVLYSTMHTIGVAETVRRAIQPFSGSEKHGMAADIMESLRMIVTQILVPKVGGGKVACREFLIFTDEIRRQLFDTDIEKWGSEIRKIMQEGRGNQSQTMLQAAERRLEAGEISEQTYRHIAAKTGVLAGGENE